MEKTKMKEDKETARTAGQSSMSAAAKLPITGDQALALMKNTQLVKRSTNDSSAPAGNVASVGYLKQQKQIALMSANKDAKEAASASSGEPAKQEGMMAKFQAFITVVLPIINKLLVYVDIIAPYVVMVWNWGVWLYGYLPVSILQAIYGLILCFFGGMYPLTIAAAETLRVSGGDRVWKCVCDIFEDVKNVHNANQIDNKKDDDGNGIADVDEISKEALMSRKMALVLKTVDPNRILQASGGLAQAMAGVCATLKLQFARVIAVAVSISDKIRPIAIHILAPVLVAVIPSDYHHWIFPMIDVLCKFVASSVAWFLFRILNSVHAGLIGGLACSRALLKFARNRGWTSLEDDQTFIDEVIGWSLAGVGVWFQISNGMSAPFPLNIVLLPVTMTETYLQWTITD